MRRTHRPDRVRGEKSETPQSKKFAIAAIIGLSGLLGAGMWAHIVQEQRAETSRTEAASTYTPSTSEKEDQAFLSVIGDSYTGGSDEGGYQEQNWVPKAVRLINDDSVAVKFSAAGIGGSGYVSRGPTDRVFGDVVSEAVTNDSDVVLFFGSINDMNQPLDEIGDAATKAYEAAQKKAPDATLVVAGPAWMEAAAPQKLHKINDVLQDRADKAGAVWIDPLGEDWFVDRPELIGEDGIHPTDKGHSYTAEKFVPHLQPLFD